MNESINKGDVLQRIAGISFIVGGILSFVFGPLQPASDPEDKLDVIQTIADNNGGFWEVDHFFLAISIWAITIGVIGSYRAISSGAAAALARIGFYGVLLGTALLTVLLAEKGVGLGVLAEQWEDAAGPDKAMWFSTFAAMDHFLVGLRSMALMAYWMAFIFFGIGVALSKVYPAWLGWAISAVGILGAVVGFVMGVAGEGDVILALFLIALILTNLWAVAMGIFTLRKAW